MAVSNTADLFNQLFGTFTSLAVLVAIAVFALMTYLIVKFRARESLPDPEDAPRIGKIPQARGHLKTVIISVTLSSIVLGVLIFGTFNVTDQITQIPDQCKLPQNPGHCLYVHVTAYRFSWNFTYGNGKTQIATLSVPIGRIVVLEINSVDVFHSFGIDDFRIKKDAMPGFTNRIWFIANEQGVNSIRCFELCGAGHAGMTANLVSSQPSDFQNVCSGTGC